MSTCLAEKEFRHLPFANGPTIEKCGLDVGHKGVHRGYHYGATWITDNVRCEAIHEETGLCCGQSNECEGKPHQIIIHW